VRRSLVAGAQQGDVQDRGRAEIGAAELALDHLERHALARELDGMRVAQLVRRGAPDSAARKPAATACSIEPKRSLATSRNCCAPSERRPGATPPGKDYTR
jgi:hypothetical protein